MRLSVQNKIQITLLLTAAIILFSNVALRLLLEAPYIEKIQEDLAKKDINRIEQVIFEELNKIETNAFSYAFLKDTSTFIINKSPDYISTYFHPKTYEAHKIDGLRIYDINENLIYGCDLEILNRDCTSISQFRLSSKNLQNIINTMQFSLNEYQLSGQGILSINNKIIMYGIATATNKSSAAFSPLGLILLWKEISPSVIKTWIKKSNIEMSLIPSTETVKLSKVENQIFIKDITGDNAFSLVYISDSKKQQALQSMWHKSILITMFISITILIISFKKIDIIFIRPLQKLASNISKLKYRSHYSQIRKTSNEKEISLITDEFNELIDTVINQQKDLKRANEKLAKQSRKDHLTGLANRRRIDYYCDEIWEKSLKNNNEISIAMIDCDYFKKYNDNYGHKKGDIVLQKIGRILRDTTKNTKNILAGRYGGEEFILIGYDTSADTMEAIVDIFQKQLSLANIEHNFSEHKIISCSIGVSSGYNQPNNTIQNLINLADQALYQAKACGRNTVVYVNS